MKTILLLSENINSRVSYFISLVKSHYEVLVVDTFNSFEEVFNVSFDGISAAVIDNPSSKAGIEEIFRFIQSKNNYMYAVPALILTDEANTAKDEEYLDFSAGIFHKGESQKIILKRIKTTCISETIIIQPLVLKNDSQEGYFVKFNMKNMIKKKKDLAFREFHY